MSDDFVDDKELLERLNLPNKKGMEALRMLDRQPGFPKKDPLFAGKRFMPAVKAWLYARYDIKSGSAPVVDGEENFG